MPGNSERTSLLPKTSHGATEWSEKDRGSGGASEDTLPAKSEGDDTSDAKDNDTASQTRGLSRWIGDRIGSATSASRAALTNLYREVTESAAPCTDEIRQRAWQGFALIRSYHEQRVRDECFESAMMVTIPPCIDFGTQGDLESTVICGSALASIFLIAPPCSVLTCCLVPCPDPFRGGYIDELDEGRRIVIGRVYADMMKRERESERMEYRAS